jgi:hypothetical protein
LLDVIFVIIPATLASTIIAFWIRKIVVKLKPTIDVIDHILGLAGARGAFDPGYL